MDTNVYPKLLAESNGLAFMVTRANVMGIRFYGFDEIRRELKYAPRFVSTYSGNLRADLLRLYEKLNVKEYKFDTRIADLAFNYYKQYRQSGGSISRKDIITDFEIVACAAVKQAAAVVSEDQSSMLNSFARRCYEEVNVSQKIKTPKLLTYQEFKKAISRGDSLGSA